MQGTPLRKTKLYVQIQQIFEKERVAEAQIDRNKATQKAKFKLKIRHHRTKNPHRKN